MRLSKIIIASFRMEEAFKVMKHKDQPDLLSSVTKLCSLVPH